MVFDLSFIGVLLYIQSSVVIQSLVSDCTYKTSNQVYCQSILLFIHSIKYVIQLKIYQTKT